MQEQIKIADESGDRKYFTQVPNYVLNHSTAIAQALYCHLKRLAGESGIAYPSSNYLRKKLGISQPTLRKEIKYLLEKNWIEFSGYEKIETASGIQKVKAYKIIDIWKLNVDYYESKRGEKIEPPQIQRGEKIDFRGVKARGEKIGNKEEPIKEEPIIKEELVSIPAPSAGGSGVNLLIDKFKEVNSSYKLFFGRPSQRKAIERLVGQFGAEYVGRLIEALPAIQGMPYAPTITSPCQLEDKLAALKAFYQKEQNKINTPKIKIFSVKDYLKT